MCLFAIFLRDGGEFFRNGKDAQHTDCGQRDSDHTNQTGERQIIPLGKHMVRWMRLERMQKSDDPSAFPALIEWEVYGCDKEGK